MFSFTILETDWGFDYIIQFLSMYKLESFLGINICHLILGLQDILSLCAATGCKNLILHCRILKKQFYSKTFQSLEQIWLEVDRINEINSAREILFWNFDVSIIATFLGKIKSLNLSVNQFIDISLRNNYLNKPVYIRNYLSIDLFSCDNKTISIKMFNYLDDCDLIKYFCSFTSNILPFSYLKAVEGPQFTNNRLGNFISAGVIPNIEFEIITKKLLENFYVIKKGNQFHVLLYQ